MKRIIIFLCFSIILTSKFVHGKTFYVDNQLSSNCTGNYSIANRSCTGSDGNAYKTVAGGVAVLASGDTMYIRSGTYDENEIWIGANYASMVTLSGHQNERPILRNNGNISTGAKYYFHFNTTTNNLTFTKVEFTSTNGRTSTPSHDGAWAMNGWLTDDRNLIVVDNCYFHDMTLFIGGNPKYWIKNSRFITWGSEPFIASNALYLQGGTTGNRTSWSDAVIVENNYFETSKYGGNYIGCAIDVHHGDTGLNVSYHIIRYNIFKGEMFWATRVDGKYAKIYNNSADRVWVFFGTNYCQYVEIENNISSNTGAYYGFAYLEIGEQQAANMTIKNNMTTGVSSIYWTTCTNCTVSGNDCSGGSAGHCDYPSADPLYLSATPSTWTDFRLQSSSPAINAGLNLGTANQNGLNPNRTTWPPGTVNQNTQGTGWEIGAFVYIEGPIPPQAPEDLGIIKD